MVPEGWEKTKLGKLVEINSGVAPSLLSLSDTGRYPYVKVEDMNNCNKYQTLSRTYTDDEGKKVGAGAILFPKRGAAIMNNKVRVAATDLYLDSNMMALLPNEGVSSEFLFYSLIREKLYRIADTSTIPQINNKHINPYPFLLPPLPEQKKIAQILSTWDQAITATERLLENSQQRKKGLMQQLLTGKKRLPGFEGEWKKVELGEALAYQQPTPFLVTSTEYSDDFPTPVLTAGKSFLLGYTDETFGIYDDGLPVIIFDDFTTASQFVDFPFKAKSSAMKILTAKPGYSIRFIFEAMRMIRFAVGGHQRHWISIFANLVIPCPSSEEQHAISEVCATADREISSLQARLDSLKSEKKALMQQLLTGKRRVNVDTEAA